MNKTAREIETSLKDTEDALRKEELRLFHSYNRHAKADVKLGVLIALQTVINKLSVIEEIKNKQ